MDVIGIMLLAAIVWLLVDIKGLLMRAEHHRGEGNIDE
jgi:hypothetical protein